MTTESADYCTLVVKVTSLLVKAGSGLLESELGQKWRHSVLKARIG